MKKITVFTPTYNREKLIKRAYNSLINQTNKEFVWLVIDDGSTDETKSVINSMINDNMIEIHYIYQKNGGKHRAHNTAVKNCDTDYFLILDSDDTLAKDAIEKLTKYIEIIDKNEMLAGIIGNRYVMDTTNVIGKTMPDIEIASGTELYQKYKHKGDTLRLYKTNILKKYLFPEINGEKFMSENIVFDAIDRKYKLLVIKDMLYFGEYQEKGYTSNISKVYLKSPKGYSLALKSKYKTAYNITNKIKYMILYIIWNIKMNLSDFYKNSDDKLLFMVCLPIAIFLMVIRKPKFFFNHFKSERRKI